MWQRVVECINGGRALMIYTARNEQRLAFQVHGHEWEPVDFDGLHLIRRPARSNSLNTESAS
jgi:CRISPR-associated protein Cas2